MNTNGIFSLCSTASNNDVVNQTECCLKQCDEPVEFCKAYCASVISDTNINPEACMQVCADQKNYCTQLCSMNWKTNWPYSNCSYDESEPENVRTCCLKECTADEAVPDCKKYCDFLAYTTGRFRTATGWGNNNNDMDTLNYSVEYVDWTWVYVLCGAILAIITALCLKKLNI